MMGFQIYYRAFCGEWQEIIRYSCGDGGKRGQLPFLVTLVIVWELIYLSV